jgi:small GTP-binding protein
MGLNDTPVSERFTIGIFGRRNAGKSSLINAITAQDIALTSSVAGTTTDPVSKTMEILPIGPVVIIDTAGLDDEGELGSKRVEKSYEALRKCQLVIFVCDATLGDDAFGELEEDFIKLLRKRQITCIVALNKCGRLPDMVKQARAATSIKALAAELHRLNDLEQLKEELRHAGRIRALAARITRRLDVPVICTDAKEHTGIDELKQAIINNSHVENEEVGLTDGLVHAGKTAILVTPIDSAAPKGRMILPQQQVLRDILDKDATALVAKESELGIALRALKHKPEVVITDSQAFHFVGKIVPEDIPLTSFSILYARQKGDLRKQLTGVRALRELRPGDTVLIAEGCTHHRQKDDIGTVKIPRMVKKIQPEVNFEWSSGAVFPGDLSKYSLIIHCGACMLNRREMQYRIDYAQDLGVPITNYGLVIAYCNGILDRALKPFGIKLDEDD